MLTLAADETVRLLCTAMPFLAVLAVQCETDVPPELANATSIQQALINFTNNSVFAMRWRRAYLYPAGYGDAQ